MKNVAQKMLKNKIVRVDTGDFEKFGRLLGRVYYFSRGKESCFNEFLLENKMAKTYGGKRKVEFTDEDWQAFS